MTAGVVFGFFMIFVGLLTVPLIPVVFGHLSASAQSITRRMIVLMSLFMPPWVYINVQLAVSRAGGDTAMGLWVDATTTLLMIIPGIFLVARYTTIGPVAMYGMVTEEEMAALEKKMLEAVKAEDYEYAAKLRDRISELKNSHDTNGEQNI